MLLSTIRTLTRLYVPKGKVSVISDTVIDLLANNAIVDVAALTVCLKKSSLFTITASQSTYSLSSVITDFLVPDKPGLWWYNGTQWKKLDPYTLKQLDNDFPSWRDHDDADPLRYSIDSDVLTLDPPPDTTLASGLKLYHGSLPPALSLATKHAFSDSTTAFPSLEILNESILLNIKWKLSGILGEDDAIKGAKKNDYLVEVLSKKKLLDRRPDITDSVKVGGEIIPEEF